MRCWEWFIKRITRELVSAKWLPKFRAGLYVHSWNKWGSVNQLSKKIGVYKLFPRGQNGKSEGNRKYLRHHFSGTCGEG